MKKKRHISNCVCSLLSCQINRLQNWINLSYSLGPQTATIPNSNKIGYKLGLERKVPQKPIEKDICPRYHPPKPIVSRYRSNSTNRSNADRKTIDSPKRLNARPASAEANIRKQFDSKKSLPSNQSVSSARQPLQTHKTNVKTVANKTNLNR